MKKMMQIRCTGEGKHVNLIDIHALLIKSAVYKGQQQTSTYHIPARFNMKCRYCDNGRVCLDRQMIEEYLDTHLKEE